MKNSIKGSRTSKEKLQENRGGNMKAKKLSKKMTIVLSVEEARKKGIDNLESEITDKLRKFAEEKGWANHHITFDADDNNFIYTVEKDGQ